MLRLKDKTCSLENILFHLGVKFCVKFLNLFVCQASVMAYHVFLSFFFFVLFYRKVTSFFLFFVFESFGSCQSAFGFQLFSAQLQASHDTPLTFCPFHKYFRSEPFLPRVTHQSPKISIPNVSCNFSFELQRQTFFFISMDKKTTMNFHYML